MAQPLRPTLRERKRYVVCVDVAERAVRDAYTELFGVHGLACAGILRITHADGSLVFRVRHDAVDRLLAAVAWSGGRGVRVAGTLKKARSVLS